MWLQLYGLCTFRTFKVWVLNFRMRFFVFIVVMNLNLAHWVKKLATNAKNTDNRTWSKFFYYGRKFWRQYVDVIDTTCGRIYFLTCKNFRLSVQRPLRRTHTGREAKNTLFSMSVHTPATTFGFCPQRPATSCFELVVWIVLDAAWCGAMLFVRCVTAFRLHPEWNISILQYILNTAQYVPSHKKKKK